MTNNKTRAREEALAEKDRQLQVAANAILEAGERMAEKDQQIAAQAETIRAQSASINVLQGNALLVQKDEQIAAINELVEAKELEIRRLRAQLQTDKDKQIVNLHVRNSNLSEQVAALTAELAQAKERAGKMEAILQAASKVGEIYFGTCALSRGVRDQIAEALNPQPPAEELPVLTPPCEGDKVRYTGCVDAQANFGGCDDPRKNLKEGCVYTVEAVFTHSWHTKVVLAECRWLRFNSVCFEVVKAQPPAEGQARPEMVQGSLMPPSGARLAWDEMRAEEPAAGPEGQDQP